MSLIAERGFSAATTAEICRRAGYSRAMVHARYGSKDALLQYVLGEYFEDRMDVVPDPSLDGLHQVLARIDAFKEFASEDDEFLRAVFVLQFEATRGELRERVATWVERQRNGIVLAIQAGLEDGSVRPELDAGIEAVDILASGIGIAYLWVTDASGLELQSTVSRWRSRLENWLSNSSTDSPDISPGRSLNRRD